MTAALFKRKTLTPPKRVCLCLKEAREARGVTLEEISRHTKINKKYLEAMELCHFHTLPHAPVYQKNFLKDYLKALNIDPKPFIQQFEAEELPALKNKPNRQFKPRVYFNWLSHLPIFLRLAGTAAIVLLLIGYLGFQVKNILEPPQLMVYAPQNGFITTDPKLLVQGETNREVRVFINGKNIRSFDDGRFKETVDLRPGVNTIVIAAKKKHGKTTTDTRYVILKPSQQVTLLNFQVQITNAKSNSKSK